MMKSLLDLMLVYVLQAIIIGAVQQRNVLASDRTLERTRLLVAQVKEVDPAVIFVLHVIEIAAVSQRIVPLSACVAMSLVMMKSLLDLMLLYVLQAIIIAAVQ